MFITFKEVGGEKTITISGSIPPGKRIAIVEIMNNSLVCHCERSIPLFKDDEDSPILLDRGVHMSKVVRDAGLDPKDFDSWSGLGSISELNYCIDELKTEENLIDGEESNILHTYLVSPSTKNTEMMRFEPKRLRFKRLKNKSITKLTLRVTDQFGMKVKEGLTSTVSLQIV